MVHVDVVNCLLHNSILLGCMFTCGVITNFLSWGKCTTGLLMPVSWVGGLLWSLNNLLGTKTV